MAIPFYNQGDQEIYESGNRFIPQEQYRLGYTAPPSIANASTGITNTNVAQPYIWPPQGGGGGGGTGNKFGLDMDTLKTITSGKYVEKGGPANQYGGTYVPTERQIAKTEGGIWKDINTNQNVYHANMPQIKGLTGTVMDFMSGKDKNRDIYEGTWTGAEWDDEFDPTIAGKQLNTYQRWKAKKEFKAAQKKAAEDKIAHDQAVAGAGAAGQRRPGKGGSHMSRSVDQGGLGITAEQAQTVSDANAEAGMTGWNLAQGGRIGFKDGLSAYQLFKLKELGYGNAGSNPGSYGGLGVLRDILKLHKYKDGGRIGYAYGTPDPEEPAENVFEFMQDQNIPMSEQVEGDPFDLRIQELMGKGLSYDDAYEIAEQEFQHLFSEGPEQDQGLASIV